MKFFKFVFIFVLCFSSQFIMAQVGGAGGDKAESKKTQKVIVFNPSKLLVKTDQKTTKQIRPTNLTDKKLINPNLVAIRKKKIAK